MNENNIMEMKTPVDAMLDMAKKEIEEHVVNCMETNSIPPGLMAYVLRSILLNVMDVKAEKMSEEFISLQSTIVNQGSVE